MRRALIVGNWKMHLTGAGAHQLASGIRQGFSSHGIVDVGVCPPFPYLGVVGRELEGSRIGLGAQDGHWAEQGAFTGWVSMPMLVDVGCTYVIIGHSERRQYAQEANDEIGRKVKAGLSHGLKVILCIGESEGQRDRGDTESVVAAQLDGAMEELAGIDLQNLILAYEPVWAIGTGKTATPRQAQDVHRFIRSWTANRLSIGFAERLVILYGGSVKPDNMRALAEMPDIDGALVGGASLKSEAFLEIIRQMEAGKG